MEDITWIGNISLEIWNFEIGDRKQLREWLYTRRYSDIKKRKHIDRPLTIEELNYFRKMCDVIMKTLELLNYLDEVYKKIDP